MTLDSFRQRRRSRTLSKIPDLGTDLWELWGLDSGGFREITSARVLLYLVGSPRTGNVFVGHRDSKARFAVLHVQGPVADDGKEMRAKYTLTLAEWLCFTREEQNAFLELLPPQPRGQVKELVAGEGL